VYSKDDLKPYLFDYDSHHTYRLMKAKPSNSKKKTLRTHRQGA
jgi:hypothetical protein